MNFLKMSDIPGREISWLMHPYIPFGKVTNISGDKNSGRTSLALAIVAAATGGHALPGQESPNAPIRALLQAPEDCLSGIKPRLEKCGADCDLIHVAPFESRRDDSGMKLLEDAIKDTGAKLFVLDPLDLYLRHADEEEYFSCVRRFSHLAASTNCAVVLVSDELPVSVQEITHSLLVVGLENSGDKYLRGVSHLTPILGENVDDYADDVLFKIHPRDGFQWIGLNLTDHDRRSERAMEIEGESISVENSRKILTSSQG
jgi:archaellum biogenesis ATPase FlaH